MKGGRLDRVIGAAGAKRAQDLLRTIFIESSPMHESGDVVLGRDIGQLCGQEHL